MTRPPSRFAATGLSLLPLGSALLAALATTGCDNPACVFSPTQCQPGDGGEGPGGIGSFSAIFPSDASWIVPAAPTVVRFAPAIVDAHEQTPLIVEFDQSLDPASLSGAFELFDAFTLTPVPLLDPPALVGDGRVVVLTVPMVGTSSPLMPGTTYLLRFTDDQEIRDVTGQAFDFGTGQDIFEFGVTDTPPTDPRVVYTYPMTGALQASDLTELVVAFDREMAAASFSTDSFAVTTNGVPPTPNPPPSSLILTGLQVPLPALQVWIWKSADSSGVRQSLGASAEVLARLSPPSFPIMGRSGGTLAETNIEFETAAIRAPEFVRKATTALPLDAIGGPNLDSGEPVLEVGLADTAVPNDTLDIFIIGGSPANAQLLKAEQRSVAITNAVDSVLLSEAELDLLEPNGVARFRDGEIEFMVRVRRGSTATAARRTDGDTSFGGFQHLLQDLTPPMLLGLGVAADSVTLVQSELGGVVIVGQGDEEIRYVRVSTSVGDNHAGPNDRPAVALSAPGGRFIAAPVVGAPDVLDPNGPAVTYTVEIFDRALNAAVPPALGTFQQLGSVGPGATPVGGNVTVRVFDADTAALIDGALVISHEDDGVNALTDLGFATTTAGIAQVPAASVGATVVTVQRTGYDSFTFYGVPTERFDVPLQRTGAAPATISGVVQRPLTPDFVQTVNWIGDNRAFQLGLPLPTTTICTLSPTGQPECNYGPVPVRAHRLGLTTFFSTRPAVAQPQIGDFLTGATLRLSEDPLGYGMNAVGQNLTVGVAQQQGVLIPGFTLNVAPAITVEGVPIVTVEAFAAGLEGAPTVGIGNLYGGVTQNEWTVLGATMAEASATGALVANRAIEADLYMRAEVVDDEGEGNRIGARPRFSRGIFLLPIDVPRFLTPGSGGMTGGEAYTIEVADVLPDTLGMDGLYRVLLVDTGGRRWHIWALDQLGNQPGMGVVKLGVPPVASLGGSPLADGAQTARVSAWGLPPTYMGSSLFDRTRFLWADVERRHEAFAHTIATPFTQN
jgi:hypothetical protein